MVHLRSLLFLPIYYAGTLFWVLTAILALPFGREYLRRASCAWSRFHERAAARLVGITYRIEGELPAGPVLVAAKHQSMYETVLVMDLLGRPAVVMKRELADMPLWGFVARQYGIIPVDRAGGAKALREMMRAAAEAIAEGRSIVIFPEGTRVAPGDMPPLQPGFAGLYRALKLTVVPLALDSGRLWPRRGWLKRPGVITLRFGAPIPPGLDRAEIEARVHRAINAIELAG